MSQKNVELFRRAIEDYNRRDIEAMLAIWHPEAEWYPFTAQVEGDDAYRDGLGVLGRAYQSHDEAIEAAGLEE